MRRRSWIPALLFGLLLPGLARADTSGTAASWLSIPPETDIWRHLLELVFPGVGPLGGAANAGASGLAEAFAAFSTALMLLGSGALAWHTVAGVVATAHEGTVLGNRWHTVWAPVRVVMGVGMLVPLSGGFGAAQILVITLACWSGSLGNVVWSAYVNGLTAPPISAPALPATGAVVRAFADAEICRAGLNEKEVEAGFPALAAVLESQSNLSTPGGVAVSAGNAWSYLQSWVTGGAQTSAASSARTMVSWDYGPCGTLSVPLSLNSGGDPVVGSFDTSRLAAFDALRSALGSAAETYAAATDAANGNPASIAAAASAAQSAIGSAKSEFDSALTAAAGTLVSAGNSGAESTFAQNAAAAGWVSAGVYYPVLSRLQLRVQQEADTLPALTVNAAASDGEDQSASLIAELHAKPGGLITGWNAAYDDAAASWSSTTPDLSSGVRAGTDGASPVSISGVLSWLFRNVFSATDSLVTGVSADPSAGSALQQMATFGSRILSAATGVLVVGIPALLVGGGVVSAATVGLLGAGGLVGYVVKLGLGIVAGALLVGVTHAYILPLLPFVLWLLAVVGMLVLVCECVVAAPIWALLHVRMDGNELVGSQQQAGYLILFNLLLRIPLLVFGLLLSLSVFQAGIWLMSVTFYPAMLAATADTSAGPVGAIVMLVLVSYLHWQLALRAFGLITALPDRVARWFGAPAVEGGEERTAGDVRALVVNSSQSAARTAVPERGRPGPGPAAPDGPGGTITRVAGAEPGGLSPVSDLTSSAVGPTETGTGERSEPRVQLAQSDPASAGDGEHHQIETRT